MKTIGKLHTVSWFFATVEYDEDWEPRFSGTRVWLGDRLSGIRLRFRNRELSIYYV